MNYFQRFQVVGAVLALCMVLLFTGCGKGTVARELEKIYFDYHKALKAEDVKALKNFLASERQKELLDKDAAMKIKMIKGFLPTNIKVSKTIVSGKKAVLKLAGKMKDQKMTGEAEFLKENGKWKLVKENWQMHLDMESSPETSSFAGKPGGFLTDPDRLPQVYQVLKGHQGDVSGIVFTPDNRFLVSAGYGDFTVKVWNIESGEEVSSVRTGNRVRSLGVTPDSSTVLTADAYNDITSWSLAEGILSNPRALVKNAGDVLAINPNGEQFVTTGYQAALQLWNINSGELVEELSNNVNLRTVVFSASGKYLANGSAGNTFTLWDTKDWSEKTYRIGKVSKDSDVFSIDISRDDRRLATGHMDSSIVIFDLQSGSELHNFYIPDASTMDVKFSPDGALLATAQYDKTVYLWDVGSAKKLVGLKGHKEAVRRLAFSPDGVTLASAGEDRLIILWRSGDADHPGPVIPGQAQKPVPKAGAPEMMEVGGVKNLVKNPYGNQDVQFWRTKGDVSVETDHEDNSYFMIKYSGEIWQDVALQEGDAGRWALLISFSYSERINRDGDQTGLPYLYGYMLNREDDHRIDAYLQGQNMMHAVDQPNKWGVIWGVFQVPETTGSIRLFLQQADGRYAQDGSAACFDEPGIYLFDSEEEAKNFAKEY